MFAFMNRLSYNVKLYVKIVNNIDHMVLQEALSALAALAAWADEWQLSVSIDKCGVLYVCLLYTSPSPRDGLLSRMPSSA